jgi:hypothetical protein
VEKSATGAQFSYSRAQVNQSAPAFYPVPSRAQLPRGGDRHRWLARQIRLAEGAVAADLTAVEDLERLAAFIRELPLTITAQGLMLDWVEAARAALLMHVWPAEPSR